MEKEYSEISISEFKATCLEVLDNVCKSGNPILVTKRGEPIALVTPPPFSQKKKSWLGMYKGQIKILSDIVSPAVDENEWETLP